MALTQTFKKEGANFRYFAVEGSANLEKILIWEPKLGGVTSVSSEKVHEFEIIIKKKGPPSPPPVYRPASKAVSHKWW